jgi:TetR/AcrR family acrAB operon transcriptional repressor
MARRTKEEAQATRELILDAAERVFHQRGVSRTSLQEIAKEAGLTRGAIYWHFENKSELFQAMMERVTLPMMVRMSAVAPEDEQWPLEKIRRNTIDAFRQVVHEPQVRRVFEIAMQRVEYVDEMQEMQTRKISGRNECMDDMQMLLGKARANGQIRADVDVLKATIGLFALIGGIKYNWLLDPTAFDLEVLGIDSVNTYLQGLGAAAAP